MIPIQNIYYMLSYVFHVLSEQGYKKVATEEYHNVADLCAAILVKGVSVQLKRGLGKKYSSQTESLIFPRGKIDIAESIKTQTQTLLRKRLVCTYDDFSVNSYMNRIIKATMVLLLKSDIPKSRKKDLRRLLVFFRDVEMLDVYSINWHIQYNRNNHTYQMLISICYLVIKGLLQTQSDGNTKLMDFLDEQRMCRLYEKFILAYYRKEFPQIKATASQIAWDLDDDFDELLPIMQSDIMLTYNGRVLIIDAKYYTHLLQSQYDANTLHSNNLYQIFTYVKNKTTGMATDSENVSGMLLYAKTDEGIDLSEKVYHMSGNKITVRMLDLNCNFSMIAAQLNQIARDHFDIAS